MQTETIYFNDLIMDWLEEMKSTHALSTYVKYGNLSRNHICPFFEGQKINEITGKQLEGFSDYILSASESGTLARKKLSPGNVRCVFMIINTILQHALKKGFIWAPLTITGRIGKKRNIVNAFSREEQKVFEEYLMQNMSLSSLGMYLCLYTGLRLGEICSLQWKDINIEYEYLYIRQTVQRLPMETIEEKRKTRLIISDPKSISSIRMVPIASFVLPYIKHYSGKYPEEVFFLTGDLHPMEPRTFQYQYKRFMEKANLSYINFHTLRHTFATRCITSGMDPKTLSEILGHADIKITLEYYFHSSFEFKKSQIERLCAFS